MKTNGDVLREKLIKMSDKELFNAMSCSIMARILGIEVFCADDETIKSCLDCKKNYLSKPYEEPKRWYLHRYSTSKGYEVYWKELHCESKNKEDAMELTFEKACMWRTILNQKRENKKNLWLLGEMKYEK